MGTNYYVRSSTCIHCNRYAEHHICKSLVTFEAKRRWDPETCESVIECGSWAEWRDFLRDEGDLIVDEYGTTLSVEEFIAKVEAIQREQRGRQHAWMVEHYPHEVSDGPMDGMSWVDADGFSFTAREFT